MSSDLDPDVAFSDDSEDLDVVFSDDNEDPDVVFSDDDSDLDPDVVFAEDSYSYSISTDSCPCSDNPNCELCYNCKGVHSYSPWRTDSPESVYWPEEKKKVDDGGFDPPGVDAGVAKSPPLQCLGVEAGVVISSPPSTPGASVPEVEREVESQRSKSPNLSDVSDVDEGAIVEDSYSD